MSDVQRLSVALANRYTVERELGGGGMAIVYLARDLKHDRNVAIKVLRAEIGAAVGAERFQQRVERNLGQRSFRRGLSRTLARSSSSTPEPSTLASKTLRPHRPETAD